MRDKGYDCIRFTSMMLIVIVHFCTEWMKEANLPQFVMKVVLRGSLSFAFIGVATFFMLSGALLWKNYKESYDIIVFYKKRFLKICIPQWIGFIGIGCVMYLLQPDYIREGIHQGVLSLLVSFMGLNFDGSIWNAVGIQPLYLIGEWFTCVIIVIYLLFPIVRWLFKEHRIMGSIIITGIFVVNLKCQFFTGDSGRFSFTNAFMYFWLGMLFEEHKDIFGCKVLVWILAGIDIILYAYNPARIFGSDILVVAIFSTILFIVLYQIKWETKFTRYICKYNYEIYLVHHRIYYIFIPLMISHDSNCFQIVLCFVVLMALICRASELLNSGSKKVYEIIEKHCMSR